MRVAYTLEQCWHRVPGGTAVAALRVAEAMSAQRDVRLIGVAGRHRRLPPDPWTPPIPVERLAWPAPWLYETWLRFGRPAVEAATGPVDVTHATTLVPCPTRARLVVTLHDLAWVHHPGHFTRHGVSVFERSLADIKRRADVVLCSSQATMDDCVVAGLAADRLRLVPLGVSAERASVLDVARVRRRYGLPDEYLLFVGTVEPRKNLRRLVAARSRIPDAPPLVVVGAEGWGSTGVGTDTPGVRFLGFVPDADLAGLYAAAAVFCYPSELEGYGLPVLEAMAQATPVVTSRGTATEETAGGAAVLVDPRSIDDIARGITEALSRRDELAGVGLAHAQQRTWAATAALTADVYRELAR